MRSEKSVSSKGQSFRNNLVKFDDIHRFVIFQNFKDKCIWYKVSQIRNLIIF